MSIALRVIGRSDPDARGDRRRLGAKHRSGETTPLMRQAWRIGPGKIFVELGLAIKQDSPFALTIVAELANGIIGYIPSRRAYARGNYEVVSARCAEGSGELLVDAAVRMLKELHLEASKDGAK